MAAGTRRRSSARSRRPPEEGFSSRVPPARLRQTRRVRAGAGPPRRRPVGRSIRRYSRQDRRCTTARRGQPGYGGRPQLHIVLGQSREDRLEIAHAQGEVHGVSRLELIRRPLLAELLSPAGFGLDYDMDLGGTEPEVGPRKSEVAGGAPPSPVRFGRTAGRSIPGPTRTTPRGEA